ncbi:hypothetical protein I316_06127 [Kwoniella heveanensis BCC8398]|uniref:Arrestin C-terminal-like domain-containing protein n=1 Tax=Kwoniella heveanensis BCC8398 TaxID=1296120 RepID=A0A1B9GML5_9TREE|nr:hypothetical protein I316_06127 [Kwoniella heveanensis BCC8398]
MSHPARLSLRAPPHLPFIQGFPGIPPSPASASSSTPTPERKAAGVHGTLELRIGHLPVKAKWVRVELRKHEVLPAGFPGVTLEGTWEHVGGISTLWQPPQGKEWDSIETADFKFFLPLPENIPPSIELPRNTGVRYELVAAMCYRQKGGLFKKESSPIVKTSEWLVITKHELHSAWPIYQVPDSRTVQAANGQINLTISRPCSAFGSGDRIQFTATLKSAKSQPFKLKGFECTLLEVVTSIPLPPDPSSTKGKKRKSLQQPIAKTRPIGTVKAVVDETVGLGGEKSARIEMHIDRALVTVKHARTIEVGYELEVKAVTDGLRDKVEMGGIVYIVGPFARAHAQEAVKDIGYVEALCPNRPRLTSMQSTPSPFNTPPGSGPNTPPIQNASGHRPTHSVPYGPVSTLTPRQSSYGAVQQMQQQYQQQQHLQQQQQQQHTLQGFIPRQPTGRPSSITTMGSDSTSTTHPAGGHSEFGFTPIGNQGQSQGRLYQTMPNPQASGTPAGRKNDVAFPSPQPTSPRPRSVTPTSLTVESGEGEPRYTQSEMGHGGGTGGYADDNKRYSSITTATFGRWDKGLQKAMGNGGESGEGTLMSIAASDATPTPTSPTVPSISTRPTSPAAAGGPSRPTSTRPPVPPPSAYMSAEAEKRMQRDLYESARSRAVATQLAQGNSLDTIGLSPNPGPRTAMTGDVPDAPPPEYAPPRPKQPDREYTAPRPLSTYTSLNGSPSNISSPASGAGASPPLAQDTISASPPRPPQQLSAFASAEQEKEAQRRRYEDAIARTGSPSASRSVSASASGSGSSSGIIDKVTRQSSIITALKSDAPLRTTQGVSLHDSAMASSSFSSWSAGPSNHHATIGLGLSSGLSEKEQMRRYYEAQDRVARAANRETSPGRVTSIGTSSVLSRKSGGGSLGSVTGLTKDGGTVNGNTDFAPSYADAGGSRIAGSSSGQPSDVGGVGPAGAAIGALSEKEQMRRYYEAQDRVAAAASGSNSVNSSPQAGHAAYQSANSSITTSQAQLPGYGSPSRGSSALASGSGQGRDARSSAGAGESGGSALSEKEQMRRYYEAQDRVAHAQRGESALQNGPYTPPRSGQRDSASSPTPNSIMNGLDYSPAASTIPSVMRGPGTAMDEKEQMRRYYEAQDRVAQANGSGSAGASGSVSPPVSKYQATPPRPIQLASLQNPGRSPRTSTSSRPSSPSPSVTASGSGSGSAQKPISILDSSSSASASANASAKPGSVVSAIDEKEQMRRYYEAMDRVQQASSVPGAESGSGSGQLNQFTGVSSSSRTAEHEDQIHESSGSGSGFNLGPMVDSPPAFEPSSSGLFDHHNSTSASASESDAPGSMSALRQQRPSTSLGTIASGYGLHHTSSSMRLGSSSTSLGDAGTFLARPNTTDPSLGTNTTNAANISTPAPASRDPTVKAGKARAMIDSQGQGEPSDVPPPPLPARPPKEYVRLLSPVGE